MRKKAVYKNFVILGMALALLLTCSGCQSPITINNSNLAETPYDWDTYTPPDIPPAAGKKPWIENKISAKQKAEIKNRWESGYSLDLADPKDVAYTFIESSDDLSFDDGNEWRTREDFSLADNPDDSKTAYFYTLSTDNYRRLEINLKQFDFGPIWYVEKYRIMRIINGRDTRFDRIDIGSDINKIRYRMFADPDEILENPDGTRVLSYNTSGVTQYDLEGSFVQFFPGHQVDFYLNKYDVVWRIEEVDNINLADLIDEYGEPREKEDNIYWYQCEDQEYKLGFVVTNEIAVKKIIATYKDMSEAKELPIRPEDCAHDYAYAVINGHGRRQFAFFDDVLQEETRESFEAQGWMTTKSSPFVTNHEEIKISDLEYEIIFSPNPFPGDLDSGSEYQVLDTTLYVTLVQEGEYYKITCIKAY